jgi:uncharacterized membrane protein
MSEKRNIIPLDLLIILAWTIMAIVSVAIPFFGDGIIKTILGVPMVLFIPGYLLVSVIYAGMDDIDTVKRIALSLGLSIAVISLLGLLLNFTFGLTPITVISTLCIYDIIFIFASKYRREKLPEEKRFSVRFDRIYKTVCVELKPKGNVDTILTVILIFTILLAIGMVYYVIATPKIGERFTEFYILDANGKANDYPTDMKLGSSSNISVYISNHEYEPTNYTVQIVMDGDILVHKQSTLDNNDVLRRNITFVPNKEGNNMKLEFLLFKGNNFKSPYRNLSLLVNVYK